MKLKKFSTEIFAGINDRSYEFEDGLNILLGDNEAGKSTIINAIYAALFIEPQIKLNRSEGIMFKNHYFPYPDGDHASAELVFEAEKGEYKFYKKWSNSNYGGYLELPDGVRIEKISKIEEYKKEIFPYGKSTYNNIVFSSQKDIKSTIERISAENNPELIDTISSFLRKAVMELDGVSVDQFRTRLEEEIDELLKKWDLDSNSVANSDRGLNNPYQKGTGKIYESYIEKERLRRRIKETEINENNFSRLSQEIKELKSSEKEVLKRINSLEEIEADINRRSAVEIEVKNTVGKIERLRKINKKWPEFENEYQSLKAELNRVESELSSLREEKERAEKFLQKEKMQEKLQKAVKLKEELENLQEKIEESKISTEKVAELEKYQNRIKQSQASLKAARLRAKINYSASEKIKITAGVEEEREAAAGEIIEADGYIRIKTDHLDIEIESAEIDFSALEKEFKLSKKSFAELSSELNVENLAAAREKLAEFKEMESRKRQISERLNDLLAEQSFEDLKKRLEEVKDLREARKLEEVEKEIENKKEKEKSLETQSAIKKSNIEGWEEEYQSLDSLKKILETLVQKQKNLAQELTELTSLPAEYESTEEFTEDLKAKRNKREELNSSLREKLQELKNLENKLPEISTAEMKNELKELENRFENLIERANNLLKIREVFLNKLEEMDKNSFKPLLKSFSNNLKELTAGKYETGVIDDDFKVELKSEELKQLPANLELLSFGTYDAAALALRFAIFDNLFKEHGGFIILDDCLVNLDPKRRKKAVKLINQFQEKYQIIYSTCNPERAREFDANIIHV